MGVTISTHNGSAVRQAHNIRDARCVEKEPHIDPNGVHETWAHESVRDAYKRLFNDSVQRYNERQERPERRIKDYYARATHTTSVLLMKLRVLARKSSKMWRL